MTRKRGIFEWIAHQATVWSGSTWAFTLAAGTIIVWAATGPVFGFSDTWQLVINTSTTIVTFLMVFLIQRSQNKESLAIQLKLNELVAALGGASNRLINVEDLSEQEVKALHRHYQRLVELAKVDHDITQSHSIEEAEGRHRAKLGKTNPAKSVPSKPSNDGEGAEQANGFHPANSTRRSIPREHSSTTDPHESLATTEEGQAASNELADFLQAAERLREKLRWHEESIADHQAGITTLKEALVACTHDPNPAAKSATKSARTHSMRSPKAV